MFLDLHEGILDLFAEAQCRHNNHEVRGYALLGIPRRWGRKPPLPYFLRHPQVANDLRALPLCQVCKVRTVTWTNPRKCIECLNRAMADGCSNRRTG